MTDNIVYPQKEVIKNIKKYSKMNFEDYFKEWKDGVNKTLENKRNKQPKLMRIFYLKSSSILDERITKAIALQFFDYGRLKAITKQNKDILDWENKK